MSWLFDVYGVTFFIKVQVISQGKVKLLLENREFRLTEFKLAEDNVKYRGNWILFKLAGGLR